MLKLHGFIVSCEFLLHFHLEILSMSLSRGEAYSVLELPIGKGKTDYLAALSRPPLHEGGAWLARVVDRREERGE